MPVFTLQADRNLEASIATKSPARPTSTPSDNTRHRFPAHPAPHVFVCHSTAQMADHAQSNSASKKDAPLRSIANATSPRSPPAPLQVASSPHSGHRSSFAENMRGLPNSPRATRQPSLSQQAMQELLNNSPTQGGESKFSGRDWKSVQVGEVVDEKQVRFAELDTSVEEATNVSRCRAGLSVCGSTERVQQRTIIIAARQQALTGHSYS